MRPYVNALVDLFYPPKCAGCGERASDVLCEPCLGELPLIEGPVCGRCGGPTAFETYGCEYCKNRNFAFAGARSPVRYEEVGKRLVQALKYRGYVAVANRIMAPLMAGIVEECFDAVAFVPLHRWRRARRGFNQAELVARGVSGELGVPVRGVLRVRRQTRDQVQLSEAERRENVAGAFEATETISGRVLLVDDVFTTGATLDACAQELREAGAREVIAISFCRAC